MNSEARRAPATATPQTVIDEIDASRYLGLSRSWLRQGRMHGRGPAYLRIGRVIRYRVSDLDAWLEGHRVTTAA